ncbi:MAG: EAL domain-containing protein [Xanthomonadaceae bacterium]|nr:EAL domain-containing protein [Xanthomonadaceae bacterium]
MSSYPTAPTVAKGVLAVTWPFLSIITFLVMLAFFSMDTLSAARAYVGGESLWTKGQKEAVQQLEEYARTGDPRHYAAYLDAIAIPLGDHAARTELDRPAPDRRTIDAGFARGGNAPGDFGRMTRMYRHFRNYGPVARAIAAWREADARIFELMAAGAQIHRRVQDGQPAAAIAALARVHAIDGATTPLERRFSVALGEASRQAEGLLRMITLCCAVLLAVAGLASTRGIVASERRMAATLEFSEARQKLAIAASRHGIWDIDIDRRRMHLSPGFMAALGYPEWPDQVPLAQMLALLHPGDRELFARRVQEDDHEDTGRECDYRLRSADGETRWVRVQGGAMRNDRGRRIRLAGAMRDITEQKLAEERLFGQKALALVTLQSIREAVVTTDARGRVDYMNPSAETLLQARSDASHGTAAESLCHFIDEASRQELPHPTVSALAEARPVELATRAALVLPDGSEIPVDASCSLIVGQDGSTLGAVLVLRDARQERATAAQITYQATHDPLTGLVNRSEFEHRVAAALDQVRRTGVPHALMFLDLDQFKIVNDTCGHVAGDELLRQLAQLMPASLRGRDTLARLGGDEFGVLLQRCHLEHAARVAEALRDQVSRFRFYADGRAFSVGVSIGLVAISDDFEDLSAIMRAADAACYLAKEKGRDRIQVYRATDADLTRRRGMVQWTARVREALDEDRFCLYAQRIEPAAPCAQAPLHFEVLLRMQEADGKLVSPSMFLPAAERYGLVQAVDRWVVAATFRALGRARDARVHTCSVNLSGASLGDLRFAEAILALAGESGVAPAQVCFEVTETAVISEIYKAQKFIERLRDQGFRFALDDFGSGMASFGYLKHLPIDYLKIDGAFVGQMRSDRTDRAMVDSINQIGKIFGLRTIAEFVENDATRTLLHEMGVDYVQGHGVARPLPLARLLDRTRNDPPPPRAGAEALTADEVSYVARLRPAPTAPYRDAG